MGPVLDLHHAVDDTVNPQGRGIDPPGVQDFASQRAASNQCHPQGSRRNRKRHPQEAYALQFGGEPAA